MAHSPVSYRSRAKRCARRSCGAHVAYDDAMRNTLALWDMTEVRPLNTAQDNFATEWVMEELISATDPIYFINDVPVLCEGDLAVLRKEIEARALRAVEEGEGGKPS